jgi:hypothetical protein
MVINDYLGGRDLYFYGILFIVYFLLFIYYLFYRIKIKEFINQITFKMALPYFIIFLALIILDFLRFKGVF